MIKSPTAVFILFFTFWSTLSNAALIDRGNGMIYDDDIDLTIMQNANYAMTSGYDADGLMSWQEAMTWADQLEFGGYNNWRLFSTDPCTDTTFMCPDDGNEAGHVYFDELGAAAVYPNLPYSPPGLSIFNNVLPNAYWSSSNYFDWGDRHSWWFSFDGGEADEYNELFNIELGAWAVADGDIASIIPVPAAVWLFGSGLIALIGISRRHKNI